MVMRSEKTELLNPEHAGVMIVIASAGLRVVIGVTTDAALMIGAARTWDPRVREATTAVKNCMLRLDLDPAERLASLDSLEVIKARKGEIGK